MHPFEGSEIERREYAAIHERRAIQAASSHSATPANATQTGSENETQEMPTNRIGWACSAGGIRSSIFSFGVLQAFAHTGLLRHIDYLIGVSGGGFTVAHVAAQSTLRPADDKLFAEWGMNPQTGQLNRECMTSRSVGRYLTDRLSGIGRYLYHTLFVLGFSLGLLVTIASVVAIFHRLFDQELTRAQLDYSGITLRSVDLAAAFVPFWILLFWAVPPFLVVVINNWTAKRRDEIAWVGIEDARSARRLTWASNIAWGVFIVQAIAFISMFVMHAADVGLSWFDRRIVSWVFASSIFMPAVLAIVLRLRTAGSTAIDDNWPRWQRILMAFFLSSFTGLVIQYCFPYQPIVYLLTPGIVVAYLLVFGDEQWRSFSTYFRIVLVLLAMTLVSSAMIFQGNGIGTIGNSTSPINILASGWLKFVAVIAGGVQLTVMFGLSSLLKSEQDDTQTWKRYIFSAGLSVLTVVPFALAVLFIGRENVSGFAKHRDAKLMREDVKSWPLLSANFPAIYDGLGKSKDARKVVDDAAEIDRQLEELRNRGSQPSWERYQSGGFWDGKILGAMRFCDLLDWDSADERLQMPDDNQKSRQSWHEYSKRYENDFIDAAERATVKLNRFINDPELSKRLSYLIFQEAAKGDSVVSPKNVPNRDAVKSMDTLFVPAHLQNETESWFVGRCESLGQQATGTKAWAWLVDPHGIEPELRLNQSGRILDPELVDIQQEECASYNRLMLEVLYPDIFRSRLDVSTPVVHKADQHVRYGIFWIGLGVMIACGLVSANWTPAFFHVYKERLQLYFLQLPANKALTPISLKSIKPWTYGLPIPIWIATGSWRRSTAHASTLRQEPYIFSPLGSYLVDLRKQKLRTQCTYDADDASREEMPHLATVAAISGSAFNAFVPSHPLLKGVMFALNLQLGQWLRGSITPTERWSKITAWFPNSLRYHISVSQLWLQLVGASRFLISSDVPPSKIFVADGGFVDSLGIEEMIRRRCRLIITSDGSFQGGKNYLQELGRAIRQAEARHGVLFLALDEDRPVDLHRLDRGESQDVPQRFLICRVRYPEPVENEKPIAGLRSDEALFVYMLMSMSGVESAPLLRMRAKSPSFPDEPTANQSFSSEQTDCYRLLGYEIGLALSLHVEGLTQMGGDSTARFGELLERLRLGYFSEAINEASMIGDVTASSLGEQSLRCLDSHPPFDGRYIARRCQRINAKLHETLDQDYQRVFNSWFEDAELRTCSIAFAWLRLNGKSVTPPDIDDDVSAQQRRYRNLVLLNVLAVKELVRWDDVDGLQRGSGDTTISSSQHAGNNSASRQRVTETLRIGGRRALVDWVKTLHYVPTIPPDGDPQKASDWLELVSRFRRLTTTTVDPDVQPSPLKVSAVLGDIDQTVLPHSGTRITTLACLCAACWPTQTERVPVDVWRGSREWAAMSR